MAGILVSVEATIILPLVSQLPQIYDVGAVAASWLITSTLLVGTLATPIVSRMADMYGKRRMIVISMGGLVAGSLILALSSSFVLAVVGRSVQGLGAALIPVAMSIMKEALPARRLGSAIALVSATMGIGAAVGLPVSGALYSWLGWSSLWWFSAGIGAVFLVVIWRALPAGTRPETRGTFDWLGTAMLILTLVPILLVISQGNEWGWHSGIVIALLVVGVVTAALLIPWELRSGSPLIDVRLSVKRPVLLTNLASMAISLGMLANLLIVTGQLGAPEAAGGFGLSAGATGLATAIPSSVLVLSAPFVGRLLNRLGGRVVLAMGGLVMAAGYASRLLLNGSVAQVVVGAVVVSVGTSLALSSTPMIIMGAVPANQTASANGVNTLFRTIGTTVSTAGLAALTSVTFVIVGGHEYATPRTYMLACAICAVTALVAAVLAWLIPREHRQGVSRRPRHTARKSIAQPAAAQVEEASPPDQQPGEPGRGTTRAALPAVAQNIDRSAGRLA